MSQEPKKVEDADDVDAVGGGFISHRDQLCPRSNISLAVHMLDVTSLLYTSGVSTFTLSYGPNNSLQDRTSNMSINADRDGSEHHGFRRPNDNGRESKHRICQPSHRSSRLR